MLAKGVEQSVSGAIPRQSHHAQQEPEWQVFDREPRNQG
jgi:hypothetical protein